MKRRSLMVSVVVTLAMGSLGVSRLQAQDSLQVLEELTLEKKRVLILPTDIDEEDTHSIDKEVTATIASLAVRLGRFEVIDRNNLRSILAEQDLVLLGLVDDSSAVAMGKIAAAREALLVEVLGFSQKGVRPESDRDEDDDDSGVVGTIVKDLVRGIVEIATIKAREKKGKDEELYPGNIQTALTVEVRSLDVETGEALYSFVVGASHTGGSKGKSRAETMKQFRRLATKELKAYYLLHSQVLDSQGDEVLLLLGSDVGIRRNMVFTISEPDRMETFGDKEIAIPGRMAGYAVVSDVSRDSNRSVVTRAWRPIRNGYKAEEYPGHVGSIRVAFCPPVLSSYYSLGLQLNASAIHSGSWGVEVGACNLPDSFGDRNAGMKLAAFGGKRIFNAPTYSIEGDITASLDIAFKSDDEDERVSTAIPALILSGRLELLLSAKTDLVLTAGYRFGGRSGSWNRLEDEDSQPSVWYQGTPRIDISGLFLTVGLQFYTPVLILGV
ncbi:MAG: hypothetical protein JSW54_10775 [Fidelibacterota bacterium]|nr:MAG: hypothetical protein JSW54_10775 [Candidatus Neomarinimicrobiota bacterium]